MKLDTHDSSQPEQTSRLYFQDVKVQLNAIVEESKDNIMPQIELTNKITQRELLQESIRLEQSLRLFGEGDLINEKIEADLGTQRQSNRTLNFPILKLYDQQKTVEQCILDSKQEVLNKDNVYVKESQLQIKEQKATKKDWLSIKREVKKLLVGLNILMGILIISELVLDDQKERGGVLIISGGVGLLVSVVDSFFVCLDKPLNFWIQIMLVGVKQATFLAVVFVSIQDIHRSEHFQLLLFTFLLIFVELTRRVKLFFVPFFFFHLTIFFIFQDYSQETITYCVISIILAGIISKLAFNIDSLISNLFLSPNERKNCNIVGGRNYPNYLFQLHITPDCVVDGDANTNYKNIYINGLNAIINMGNQFEPTNINLIQSQPQQADSPRIKESPIQHRISLSKKSFLRKPSVEKRFGSSYLKQDTTKANDHQDVHFDHLSLANYMEHVSKIIPFPYLIVSESENKSEVTHLSKQLDASFMKETHVDELNLSLERFVRMLFNPKYKDHPNVCKQSQVCSNSSRSAVYKMFMRNVNDHEVLAADRRVSGGEPGCVAHERKLVILYFCDITDVYASIQPAASGPQSPNQPNYKDELLAAVSHDFKNFLNGMVQMLDLCEAELQTLQANQMFLNKLSRISEFISLAQRNSQLLLFLVFDMQDYYQHQKQKLRLCSELINVEQLITEIKGLFIQQVSIKGISLTVVSHLNTPLIFTDGYRLKQVLVNLISNAIKYTSKGGVFVTFKPTRKPALIKIYIADTGSGIPDSIKNELFKLYSTFNDQLDQNPRGMHFCVDLGPPFIFLSKYHLLFCDDIISHQYLTTGVGLGLVISQKIVQEMGPSKQHIKLTSEKGKGTIFSFLIYSKLHEKNLGSDDDSNSISSIEYSEARDSLRESVCNLDSFAAQGLQESANLESHQQANTPPFFSKIYKSNDLKKRGTIPCQPQNQVYQSFNPLLQPKNDEILTQARLYDLEKSIGNQTLGGVLSKSHFLELSQQNPLESKAKTQKLSNGSRLLEFYSQPSSGHEKPQQQQQQIKVPLCQSLIPTDSHKNLCTKSSSLQALNGENEDYIHMKKASSRKEQQSHIENSYQSAKFMNNIHLTCCNHSPSVYLKSVTNINNNYNHTPSSEFLRLFEKPLPENLNNSILFQSLQLKQKHQLQQQQQVQPQTSQQGKSPPGQKIRFQDKWSTSIQLPNASPPAAAIQSLKIGGKKKNGKPNRKMSSSQLLNNQLFSSSMQTPLVDELSNEEFVNQLSILGVKKILIVDDEPMNTFILQETLNFIKPYGIKLIVGHSGEEAVSFIESEKSQIQLVFIDSNMPMMNGIQAIQAMKMINPDIMAIVVSGDSRPEDIYYAESNGADGYLTKPVQLIHIKKKILQILKRKEEEDLTYNNSETIC